MSEIGLCQELRVQVQDPQLFSASLQKPFTTQNGAKKDLERRSNGHKISYSMVNPAGTGVYFEAIYKESQCIYKRRIM